MGAVPVHGGGLELDGLQGSCFHSFTLFHSLTFLHQSALFACADSLTCDFFFFFFFTEEEHLAPLNVIS